MIFLALALVSGSIVDRAEADEILYYVDGGEVVFTNVPSRSDARPVPHLSAAASFPGGTLPATRYDPFIHRVAGESGVDASLIKAVALVESGFEPRAVSRKGARGIMQLMPATARRYGVTDPHDPYQSLRAGAQHLRDLLDEFGGDLSLALAAYNAGSGAVRRHGGLPAYRETREYVQKVQGRLGGRRRPATAAPAPVSPVTLRLGADGSVLLAN